MSNNALVNILNPQEIWGYYNELKGIAEKLFCFLTVSSLFIGGTGFFKTFMAFVFLGANPVFQVCLVGFLATFSVYSMNKLTDLKEDAVNMPERLRFLAGRRNLVLSYSLAAYALSILLAFMDMPLTVPIIFIPIAANLIYSSKLLPGIPRFKDIPIMKNLFVAASWAICATLFSAMHAYAGSITVIAVFLFILTKSFINTVIYDIRDEEGDRNNGVRTIPVLLGRKKTVAALLLMNSALLPLLAFTGILQPLAIAMVIYGYAYILYFGKRRNPLVLDIFVDGEWMHACALFLILKDCGILLA